MGVKKSIWINIYKKELALNWFLLVTLLVQWSCKLNEATKVLAKDWAPRSSPRGASGDWQTAAQRPSTAISSLRSPQTCLIIPSRTPLECDTALVLHRTRRSWERLSIALVSMSFWRSPIAHEHPHVSGWACKPQCRATRAISMRSERVGVNMTWENSG